MNKLFEDCALAQSDDAEVFAPTENDKRRACIDSALASDNPAVMDALTELFVLVRLVDETDYQERLAWRGSLLSIGASHAHRIPREEAHAMVDTVLDNHHMEGMLALGRFITVARHPE